MFTYPVISAAAGAPSTEYVLAISPANSTYGTDALVYMKVDRSAGITTLATTTATASGYRNWVTNDGTYVYTSISGGSKDIAALTWNGATGFNTANSQTTTITGTFINGGKCNPNYPGWMMITNSTYAESVSIDTGTWTYATVDRTTMNEFVGEVYDLRDGTEDSYYMPGKKIILGVTGNYRWAHPTFNADGSNIVKASAATADHQQSGAQYGGVDRDSHHLFNVYINDARIWRPSLPSTIGTYATLTGLTITPPLAITCLNGYLIVAEDTTPHKLRTYTYTAGNALTLVDTHDFAVSTTNANCSLWVSPYTNLIYYMGGSSTTIKSQVFDMDASGNLTYIDTWDHYNASGQINNNLSFVGTSPLPSI